MKPNQIPILYKKIDNLIAKLYYQLYLDHTMSETYDVDQIIGLFKDKKYKDILSHYGITDFANTNNINKCNAIKCIVDSKNINLIITLFDNISGSEYRFRFLESLLKNDLENILIEILDTDPFFFKILENARFFISPLIYSKINFIKILMEHHIILIFILYGVDQI